jgi:hypothetical protein
MENHVILKNKGQGVFIFHSKHDCTFTIYNQDKNNGLIIDLTKDNIIVTQINPKTILYDPNNTIGLTDSHGVYYWFSLDSQNQRLYYGIGEPRLETYKYFYQLKHEDKPFLESLVSIEYDKNITFIKLIKDPITRKLPLVVKHTNELNMMDIAQGNFMPKSNLSLIGQKLYDCIAGKNFILNTLDFPEFSKAIEHSIATPGLWCNTTLKNKSHEFNKSNIKETYLRITLGENNGESPGVPYVMEIWPIGHYSPIHSHSAADAIIRVLHGSIHVKLFPYLGTLEPFGSHDFKKDEITWISPTLNQTHQLKNLNSNVETCITIQCYMYNQKDKIHYDYFDYIDNNGHKYQYEPDSDMDFVQFKELMKKEWNARVSYFWDNFVCI